MHCSLLLNCLLQRTWHHQQNLYRSHSFPKEEVPLLVAKTNPVFVQTALHLLNAYPIANFAKAGWHAIRTPRKSVVQNVLELAHAQHIVRDHVAKDLRV